MQRAVAAAVEQFGGLDVVVANAGVAAQLPLIGGRPEIFEKQIAVNVLGVYYTVRAAGEYISHPDGYALLTASLAAAVHLPLMGPYNASKAAVEALGDTLRIELKPSGARVGVAYYAEIDTDMTSRGFGTEAAAQLTKRLNKITRVAPLSSAVDAVERGIANRSRRVWAPAWVGPLLPFREVAQRVVEVLAVRDLEPALEIARREQVSLTTVQPGRDE
jgi:NAD(P)-dependent dehydrogenase (short-subunit alcohol dehydrogenase family)